MVFSACHLATVFFTLYTLKPPRSLGGLGIDFKAEKSAESRDCESYIAVINKTLIRLKVLEVLEVLAISWNVRGVKRVKGVRRLDSFTQIRPGWLV